MDFITCPTSGFLNTNYGIKIIDYVPGESYKISFSNEDLTDETHTNDLYEETIIYKKFDTPGIKHITLHTKEQSIIKEIEVFDTLSFGNGTNQKILFMEKSDTVIQIKSIGLNIYYKALEKLITVPFKPDDFFEVNSHLVLFIKYQSYRKESSSIAYFNLDRGIVESELEGRILKNDPEKSSLVYATNDSIIIISDGTEVKIAGIIKEIITFPQNIVYEYNNQMIQLDLDDNSSTVLPSCNSTQHYTGSSILKLINDKIVLLWNLAGKKVIMENPPEDLFIFADSSFLNRKVLKNDYVYYDSEGKTIHSCQDSFTVAYRNCSKDLILNLTESFLLISADTSMKRTFVPFIYSGDINSDLIKVKTKDGQIKYYSLLKGALLDFIESIEFGFENDGCQYLVCKNSTATDFYKYSNASIEKIATYEGNCSKDYIRNLVDNNILWVVKDYREYRAYKGITDELLIEFIIVERIGNWFYTSDNKFVHINTLEEVSIYPDSVKYIRPDLREVIRKGEDGWYLLSKSVENGEINEKKLFDNDKIYTQSEIHPNGRIAILGDGFRTELIDVFSGEVITVEASTFIEFKKDSIVLQNSEKHSMVRIIDPVTFEVVEEDNPNRISYRYSSRDRKLSSNSWGGWNNYHSYFTTIDITDNEKNKNSPISIYRAPRYINHIAFSRDNRIFAYAGATVDKGVIEIFAIENIEGDIKQIAKNYTYVPNALWKVAFSPSENLVVFYDSKPNTYVFRYNFDNNCCSFYQNKIIEDRSVECFSPDGNILVLSQNKYEAVTVGGGGWLPSNKIFLIQIGTWNELDKYEDHHDEIVFANISVEGNKMISRSRDGIVIVRSI